MYNFDFQMGTCKSFLKRFHYDSETGMCQPFIFSGCQGNANNFENLNDCVQTCVVIPSQPVTLPAEVDLFKARTI